MRLLFVYPMKVYKINEKYYVPSLTNGVLERYISIFDSNTTLDWYCTIILESKQELLGMNEINYKKFNLKDCKENKIRNIIKTYDFVICRVPNLFSSHSCAYYCRKYKIPYVLEVVGCSFDAFWYHSIKGKIVAPFSYILHRYTIKRSQNIVYVTKSYLQKKYPNRKNNIFISDVELFDNSKINVKHSGKIILATIGAIDIRYKNQETVLRAIKILVQKGYNVEYKLIGPGDKKFLHNLAASLNIQDNVKFIGPIAHEDIPSHINDLTYYVQPSLTEGLPRSVLEVESIGIPVISTSVGGMVDIVRDDLQFRKKDFNSLAFIIENNLTNVAELSKYSLEIVKQFNQESMFLKTKDFYNQAYENGGV